MRRLQAEPGQLGFDAEKLTRAPLVFIWIPVGIILLAMVYCVVRCALRRRQTGMASHDAQHGKYQVH
jgi:hypothetical protein